MILINSTCDDQSTNDCLDWVFFLSNTTVCRLNDKVEIQSATIKIDNEGEYQLLINEIDYSKFTAFWYRRGHFSLVTSEMKAGDFMTKLKSKLQSDACYILPLIEDFASGYRQSNINKQADNHTNKIRNLLKAKSTGLRIPASIVTNKESHLMDFAKKYEKVITKNISQGRVVIYNHNEIINAFCTVSDIIDIDTISNTPIPSLFQEYIPKKFELRIFYLKGQFFSMAIFSQQNEKTRIDFRNYDNDRPNRCVPYVLPPDIEQKLNTFMKDIDMNCGSIDMIYTPQGEHVFLEVNPVGQYQWLEQNCNYPISKSIAEELIDG